MIVHKISLLYGIITAGLLASYGNYAYAENSYVEQSQKNIQNALDLNNKQLQAMYEKNTTESFEDVKKRLPPPVATTQPSAPIQQPAWQQAVTPQNPATAPLSAPSATPAPPTINRSNAENPVNPNALQPSTSQAQTPPSQSPNTNLYR